MDSRTALSPNSQLRFGQEILFTIRGEVGRGSSCIVYDGSYVTHAGDEKTVRIKECYPFGLRLERTVDGALICPSEDRALFDAAVDQMFTDFKRCNSLFYGEPASDSIINNLDIYRGNNTVYTVSSYSRENTLNAVELSTLKDCISVVKQTAHAIHCIHEAGFLYLDTKPENISVISGYGQRIHLFDFDSLLPLENIGKSGDNEPVRLSYTKGYAALELRRGQMNKLGPYTDVYGIGALLFRLLFGRTPEAPDCSNRTPLDFSKMKFSGEEYPDRLFLLLEDFFRKSLAGFYPDRYPEMKKAISALEEIEHEADPAKAFLISSPLNRPVFFIGRDKENERIEEWHRANEQQLLFVSGMGGIGKSTFIRDFVGRHRKEWDSVLFLYYFSSLRQMIIDDDMLRISTTERYAEENEDDYFERKIARIREIARRDRVLIVIDNFSNEFDPDLQLILRLGCRIILITRNSLPTLNVPILNLAAMQDPDSLRSLFIHYLGREVTVEEITAIDSIIRAVSGHTLAVELFARQITEHFLSIEEASELLARHGLLNTAEGTVSYQRDDGFSYETITRIISSLFETDKLPEVQNAVLKLTSLFPAPGIRVRELTRLSGMKTEKDIRSLIRSGWITEDSGAIWLHPLILEVIRGKSWSDLSLQGVRQILSTLHMEITDESHREEQLRSKVLSPIETEALSKKAELICTDHSKLFLSVQTAVKVLNSLRDDPLISREKIFRKLAHAALIDLPRYEENTIMDWGSELLNDPVYLEPEEIFEIIEKMEKVLLEHQDVEGAWTLVHKSEEFIHDDRTRAEYFGLLCNIFDLGRSQDDIDNSLVCIENGIRYARLAVHPKRKHLLAEYLLGKINIISRYGYGTPEEIAEIMVLAEEVRGIIQRDCLPYSEIRHGYLMSMAFYYAEVEQDMDRTEDLLREAQPIAEKLYPAGLDYIDTMIVPPAIMYLDIGDPDRAGAILRQGIMICDSYPDVAAYIRKKHNLHQYLLDTLLHIPDYERSREILVVLDRECRQYGLPDTVHPEVRAFLEGLRN